MQTNLNPQCDLSESIQRSGSHDNSVRMWANYYSSDCNRYSFNSVIHRARALYHGRHFARRVVALGGYGKSYLEIGVGTGETLRRLQQATGARCVGVDKTPDACLLARANAIGCTIVSADGLRLPFPDRSFDVVYSLGVLEHFAIDDQRRLLREHARVARKSVLLHLPARTPHLRLVLWFNRAVCGRAGVWADEELFTPRTFRKKFPGLTFRSVFDWAAGAMTYWFAMGSDQIIHKND